MKIFRDIQKQYAMVGISSTRKHSFNTRVIIGLLLFACIMTSHFLYIVRVANGFLEYMVCIGSLCGNLITFISFAAIVFKQSLLFESIDDIEKLIGTSKTISNYSGLWKLETKKSNSSRIHRLTYDLLSLCELDDISIWNQNIYISGLKYPKSEAFFFKTSQQVERLSGLVSTMVVKITLQLLILPKFVGSFVIYFITSSGNDSFDLPIPLW